VTVTGFRGFRGFRVFRFLGRPYSMFPAYSVKTQTLPSFGCFTTHVTMRMSC